MKHLKIFESVGDEYWLSIYDVDGQANYDLYPDKESCENSLLETINDERSEFEEDYTDDMYFVDIDEALEWYSSTFSDVSISYEKITVSSKFNPSEKLKMRKNAKKYNV